MEQAIVTTVASLPPSDVFDIITSCLMAKVDPIALAGFVGDCADEAHLLGKLENERLFRVVEIIIGGATLGTPEMVEQATSHVSLLLAAYKLQKSGNQHRAAAMPEQTTSPETSTESSPAIETPQLPAETPGKTLETIVHVGVVESLASPEVAVESAGEGTTSVPQVRRRQPSKRSAKKKNS